MKSNASLFFVLVFALAGFTDGSADEIRLSGGRLVLSNRIITDQLIVGSNALLRGQGRMDGAAHIYGTVNPGYTSNDTASLVFSNLSIYSSGTYECDVISGSDSDSLVPGNLLEASGQLRVQAAENAQPYQQAVITGAGNTDFDSIVSLLPAGWGLFTNAVTESLCLTDLTLDGDADGLPDWWEEHWFMDREIGVSDEDADQDGMKNGEEFAAGTSPVDARSLLVLYGSTDAETKSFIGQWPSVEKKHYTIWYTEDLTAVPFERLAQHVAATPPFNHFTNTAPTTGTGYYRIEVEQ